MNELEEIIQDFITYRSEGKFPMTPTAERRFRRKIGVLQSQGYTDDELVHELDRSIVHGWRDIYVKEKKKIEQMNGQELKEHFKGKSMGEVYTKIEHLPQEIIDRITNTLF